MPQAAKWQNSNDLPSHQKTAADTSSEYFSHSRPCCRPLQHDGPLNDTMGNNSKMDDSVP